MRELTLTGALLDPLMRDNPAGPRITYYDDASGERVELSTATLANWAAKTANLLRDELGAGPGTRVGVLLPAHWQTAAVLLGIWWIGAEAVVGADEEVTFCTRDRLDDAGMGEVAVLSLDAFGKGYDDLPIGVTDYATAVRVHGDQVVPEANPGPALEGRSVADVLEQARSELGPSDRVISSLDWSTAAQVVSNLVAVFAAGASLVQVANPDPAAQERRVATEKITTELS